MKKNNNGNTYMVCNSKNKCRMHTEDFNDTITGYKL